MAKKFSELDPKMQLLMHGAMRKLKNSGEMPSGFNDFADFAIKDMEKDLLCTPPQPTGRIPAKRWWEFWK